MFFFIYILTHFVQLLRQFMKNKKHYMNVVCLLRKLYVGGKANKCDSI